MSACNNPCELPTQNTAWLTRLTSNWTAISGVATSRRLAPAAKEALRLAEILERPAMAHVVLLRCCLARGVAAEADRQTHRVGDDLRSSAQCSQGSATNAVHNPGRFRWNSCSLKML